MSNVTAGDSEWEAVGGLLGGAHHKEVVGSTMQKVIMLSWCQVSAGTHWGREGVESAVLAHGLRVEPAVYADGQKESLQKHRLAPVVWPEQQWRTDRRTHTRRKGRLRRMGLVA